MTDAGCPNIENSRKTAEKGAERVPGKVPAKQPDQISFNRDGFNAMPSNPTQSNTTDSNQMPSNGLCAARPNPDHSNQMPSNGLSAARLNPDPASTSPFDQLDPLRTQSNYGLSPRDPSSRSQNPDDIASIVKQIANLNRYVTTLEGKLVTRIEVCESDVNMASNQALELVAQYNEVSRNLSMGIQPKTSSVSAVPVFFSAVLLALCPGPSRLSCTV